MKFVKHFHFLTIIFLLNKYNFFLETKKTALIFLIIKKKEEVWNKIVSNKICRV